MTSRTRHGEGVRPKASQSNNKKRLHLKSEGDAAKKFTEQRDTGARIAEAVQAELGVNSDDTTDGTSLDHTYRDPAPLKWRIFETVAKTNGQRYVMLLLLRTVYVVHTHTTVSSTTVVVLQAYSHYDSRSRA